MADPDVFVELTLDLRLPPGGDTQAGMPGLRAGAGGELADQMA
jgi:hypothetical protein